MNVIPSDGFADGGEPYTDEEMQQMEDQEHGMSQVKTNYTRAVSAILQAGGRQVATVMESLDFRYVFDTYLMPGGRQLIVYQRYDKDLEYFDVLRPLVETNSMADLLAEIREYDT
jgi:hypothetical protein